jgi:hypothetical protein
MVLAMPITPASRSTPLMTNVVFMYRAVSPSPRPLMGWVIDEYGEIHVPATV